MENVFHVSDSEESDLDDDTVNQKDSVTEPDPANVEFESKKISELQHPHLARHQQHGEDNQGGGEHIPVDARVQSRDLRGLLIANSKEGRLF